MLPRICHLLRIKPPVAADPGLLWGSSDTVPTLADEGWQTGAIYQQTDGAHGTCLYVNEGSVTSCNFVAVDTVEGDEAGAITFDADTDGPCIATTDGFDDSFIETGTYASTADEGIVISATNNRPVSLLFDDGGDALASADYRAGLFRILLSVDQANAVTINALRAQIKVNNLVDITSPSSVTSPLTGYLELDGAGARHLDGHIGCVRAALETGAGAHTVDLNLCGFESTLHSSGTFVGTGYTAAFAANIHGGTSLWQHGLNVEAGSCLVGVTVGAVATGIAVGACTTAGITVGACATGISIGACTTSALTITGATKYAIDIATSGVIRVGVQDTGIDLTTTYPFAIDVQCEANAALTAGATGSSAGIYARYAVETAQTNNIAMIGMFGKLRVKADLAEGNHAGLMGWVEISGTTELGGSATTTTSAGSFSVIAESGLDLSTGHLNGLCVDCSVDDAATITGTVTGIRLKSSAGCYGWETGILVDLGTNVGATLEKSSTGMSIILPQSTNDAASPALLGLSIAAAGAMTATTSGDPTFTGISITTPACTCTLDTIVSTGLSITTGTIVENSGTMTSTGILLTGGTITSGTALGINLAGIWTTAITVVGATNLLALPALGTNPCSTQTTADYTFTKTVKIKITIGGADYYLIADTTA